MGAKGLEAKRGDSKKGIVAIQVPYAQAKDAITEKDLGGIEEVVKSVRRHVIVCKGRKGDLLFLHHFTEMCVGDCQELYPFRSATCLIIKKPFTKPGYRKRLVFLSRLKFGEIESPGPGWCLGPQADIVRLSEIDIFTLPGLDPPESKGIFPGKPSGEDRIGVALAVLTKSIEEAYTHKTILTVIFCP